MTRRASPRKRYQLYYHVSTLKQGLSGLGLEAQGAPCGLSGRIRRSCSGLRATGHTHWQIASKLNTSGYRIRRGKAFQATTEPRRGCWERHPPP